MPWYGYIIRLQRGRLHTGSTNDLGRRRAEHRGGNGGGTTAASSTMALIYSESFSDKVAARQRERQLKRWSRAKKLALANGQTDQPHFLAKSRD